MPEANTSPKRKRVNRRKSFTRLGFGLVPDTTEGVPYSGQISVRLTEWNFYLPQPSGTPSHLCGGRFEMSAGVQPLGCR